MRRSRGWFWLFVTPFLIGLLLFVYLPVLWSAYLSFFDARNTVTPTTFVGLANYQYLLTDRAFLTSLGTFTAFAACIVPLTFVCSLGLAVLVHRIPFAQTFFRSVFFIPMAVSYVVAAMIWRQSIYSGTRFGLINTILRSLGQEPVNWLGGGGYWYWLVIVSLRLWLQVGFYMILFIAGLNRIGRDSYEAAALDGAGPAKTFWYITLPQLRPTSVAVVMLLLIGAFQAFDEFYNTLISVGTYPPYARPPLVYLYLLSFGSGSQDLGLGSAGTMILTLVIVLFSLAQNWLLGRGARREARLEKMAATRIEPEVAR